MASSMNFGPDWMRRLSRANSSHNIEEINNGNVGNNPEYQNYPELSNSQQTRNNNNPYPSSYSSVTNKSTGEDASRKVEFSLTDELNPFRYNKDFMLSMFFSINAPLDFEKLEHANSNESLAPVNFTPYSEQEETLLASGQINSVIRRNNSVHNDNQRNKGQTNQQKDFSQLRAKNGKYATRFREEAKNPWADVTRSSVGTFAEGGFFQIDGVADEPLEESPSNDFDEPYNNGYNHYSYNGHMHNSGLSQMEEYIPKNSSDEFRAGRDSKINFLTPISTFENEPGEAPDSQEISNWHYKDPTGVIQGPFSGHDMHEWYGAGYFSRELLVKREEESSFEPMGLLIARTGDEEKPFLTPPRASHLKTILTPRTNRAFFSPNLEAEQLKGTQVLLSHNQGQSNHMFKETSPFDQRNNTFEMNNGQSQFDLFRGQQSKSQYDLQFGQSALGNQHSSFAPQFLQNTNQNSSQIPSAFGGFNFSQNPLNSTESLSFTRPDFNRAHTSPHVGNMTNVGWNRSNRNTPPSQEFSFINSVPEVSVAEPTPASVPTPQSVGTPQASAATEISIQEIDSQLQSLNFEESESIQQPTPNPPQLAAKTKQSIPKPKNDQNPKNKTPRDSKSSPDEQNTVLKDDKLDFLPAKAEPAFTKSPVIQAPPAPWINAKVNKPTKSLREIQKEEEAERDRLLKQSQEAGIPRRYADTLSKGSPPVPQRTLSSTKIPTEVKKETTKINFKNPPQPSDSFLSWCKGMMRGFTTINVDEFLQILLSFPLDPPNTFREMVIDQFHFCNSKGKFTQVDSLKFIHEFIIRRKVDLGVLPASSIPNPCLKPPVPIANPGANEPQFQVVTKKTARKKGV